MRSITDVFVFYIYLHPQKKSFPLFVSILSYFTSNLLPSQDKTRVLSLLGGKFDAKYDSIETTGETVDFVFHGFSGSSCDFQGFQGFLWYFRDLAWISNPPFQGDNGGFSGLENSGKIFEIPKIP
jgi:hypothetical protein